MTIVQRDPPLSTPGLLITWPLVVTLPPETSSADDANVGVYRMQVLGRDRAIIRWLAHRGGARHHHQWRAQGREMPVAIVIGRDPATILSAVLPLPETLSELCFSGLLRGVHGFVDDLIHLLAALAFKVCACR